MNYIELHIELIEPQIWKEILATVLAEEGADSFMDGESDDVLLAYIPENQYQEENIHAVFNDELYAPHIRSVTKNFIPDQDWNAVWEASFQDIIIAEKCRIRAPFHIQRTDIQYEIIINPKMAFGTAHHETTAMMIEYLLEADVKGKRVLDMGAGTGILAILASKLNADSVTAIDNDEWAYRNNIENNQLNNVFSMNVICGDANAIPENEHYDLILANINRNILLRDIPQYVKHLVPNGSVFFSGFYEGQDLEMIRDVCQGCGLHYINCKVKNNWVATKFG